jgi:hypothetical protein
LPEADPIQKRLEPLRGSNKCRHTMTALQRLPDHLDSGAAGSAQYN